MARLIIIPAQKLLVHLSYPADLLRIAVPADLPLSIANHGPFAIEEQLVVGALTVSGRPKVIALTMYRASSSRL